MNLFELIEDDGGLYHGSKVSGIKVLEPKKHFLYKKKVVYATNDKYFALAMTYGTGNDLAVGYNTDAKTNKKIMYVDELKPGTLSLLNRSGSLYTVKRNGFKRDKKISNVEFFTYESVEVIKEEKIENILTELKKNKNIELTEYKDVLKELKKRNKGKPKIKHKKERFDEEFARGPSKKSNPTYYRFEVEHMKLKRGKRRKVREGIYGAISAMPNIIPFPLLRYDENLDFYFTELGKRVFLRYYSKIRDKISNYDNIRVFLIKKRIDNARIKYKDKYQIAAHKSNRYKTTQRTVKKKKYLEKDEKE